MTERVVDGVVGRTVGRTVAKKSVAEKAMDVTQQVLFWGLGQTTYRFDSVQKQHFSYGGHQRQQLDLYLPRRVKPKMSVVFVHGGVWKSGHKDEYAFVGQALAAHGIATAVVGYRLFPEVRFPDFVNDIAQALGWLQTNGQSHGFDVDSGVVMIGHSAGAHLASLVTLNQQYAETFGFSPALVKGVVGLAGIYSLRPEKDTLMGDIFQPAEQQNDYFDVNPINYLTKGGVPLYLIHGQKDQTVACRNAERMFKDALLAGHPVDIHVENRYGHVRPIMDFIPLMPSHRRFMKKITGFIEEVINEDTGDGSDGLRRAALCEAPVQSS